MSKAAHVHWSEEGLHFSVFQLSGIALEVITVVKLNIIYCIVKVSTMFKILKKNVSTAKKLPKYGTYILCFNMLLKFVCV